MLAILAGVDLRPSIRAAVSHRWIWSLGHAATAPPRAQSRMVAM
jgi:hypothetical protein